MRYFAIEGPASGKRCTALFAALSLATAAMLSACSSPGGGQQAPTVAPSTEEPQQALASATELQLPPSEFSEQFLRAEQSLFEFDWMSAESTLATLPPKQTSPTDNQYLAYLLARIQYVRGDQTGAAHRLSALEKTTKNAAIKHKILHFQRYIHSLSGDYLYSAQLGNQLLQQTTPGAPFNTLRRNIWRDLQKAEHAQLHAAATATTDQQWLGWLELAQVTRSSRALELGLLRWRTKHPLHPAAATLPGGMDYLTSNDTPAPAKVAIVLPLSGPLALAAQAIRDGYLAEYYAAKAAGDPFELDIVDVLAFDSVTDAYNTVVANGADLVIGPLRKHAVEELGRLPNKPVPVLALNRIDHTLPASDTALVQLSLAPEDEARQIASVAFGKGGRQALVIRPVGTWGSKMEGAVRKQWQRLGGTISATATYSGLEDYSSSMSLAMNLPASEQRARGVRNMLATNVEFTARRRQDLDVVFLLCKSGAQARSLKPLLAYHYASDLPVYSTSSIYRGTADPRDQDLNGITLVEIPWLLGSNPEATAAIAGNGTSRAVYTRLNALGADAYLLQSNFTRLQAGDDMLIRGNTGLLSLTPQLHIQRELQTATFDRGALTAE